MSTDTTKKRRVKGDDSQDDNDVEMSESGTTMAAILAEMKDLKSHCNSLQNEMDSMKHDLEAKCISLDRGMQVLIRESNWEYSAPDIPSSHWLEEGFPGAYAICVATFLKKMKKYTCDMRSGVKQRQQDLGTLEEDSIKIGFPYGLLHHDDLLIPHWEEFTTALQLYQTQIRFLSINSVQLAPAVIRMLKEVLKGKQIYMFHLENNGFSGMYDTGAMMARDVIKSSQTMLSCFKWNNRFQHIGEAIGLIETIKRHPGIDSVYFQNCFEDDGRGYDMLCILLAGDKCLEHINLESNYIRTRGRTELPDYIAKNTTFQNIHLGNNNLNDEDAILIARALKNNTNLIRLRLGDNDITEIGINALSEAIYNPQSLNSVSDCNHTCTITGLTFDVTVRNFLDDLSLAITRGRKIYHLLSTRHKEGSNVHYLNVELKDEKDGEKSLVLIPNVLESVHNYSAYSTFESNW